MCSAMYGPTELKSVPPVIRAARQIAPPWSKPPGSALRRSGPARLDAPAPAVEAV
jgi:hypothetical protein